MKSLLGIVLVTIATPALAQHVHDATEQQAPTDPHAQHQTDEPSAGPHAGHAMPPKASEPKDPHAGHQMPSYINSMSLSRAASRPARNGYHQSGVEIERPSARLA